MTWNPSPAAKKWLQSYAGSIDSTGLLLAYDAGVAARQDAVFRGLAGALTANELPLVVDCFCEELIKRHERAVIQSASHIAEVFDRGLSPTKVMLEQLSSDVQRLRVAVEGPQ